MDFDDFEWQDMALAGALAEEMTEAERERVQNISPYKIRLYTYIFSSGLMIGISEHFISFSFHLPHLIIDPLIHRISITLNDAIWLIRRLQM